MSNQKELRRWGLFCEERKEKLFLLPYPPSLCYPGQQPQLRPEFDPMLLQCVGHTHEVTRENIRWMRADDKTEE
jgi:hypothetical protein